MSAISIGAWVRRAGGKWHLCESIILASAVTRCGRRMQKYASGGELEVSVLMPLTRMIGQPQLCKGGCEAREVPEDDGSTQPVETVP